MNRSDPVRAILASNLFTGPIKQSEAEHAKTIDELLHKFSQTHARAISSLIGTLDDALTLCANRHFDAARQMLWEVVGTGFTSEASSMLRELGNLRRLLGQRYDDLAMPFVLHSLRLGLADLMGHTG